jgi:hypothetical protein
MSRSYKKKNIGWMGCNSEKEYKQQYHRRFRRIYNQLLSEGEEENFPHRNKYYDSWCSPGDGKFRVDDDWIMRLLVEEPEWILKKYKKDPLGRYRMRK